MEEEEDAKPEWDLSPADQAQTRLLIGPGYVATLGKRMML